MAAPLGPPPKSAITSVSPNVLILLRVPLAISTKIIEPSFIQIGPSGNFKPLALILNSFLIILITISFFIF